jgi:hypothetical protein
VKAAVSSGGDADLQPTGDQLALARQRLTEAEGDTVNLEWSAVRRVRARRATLDRSAALLALGRRVRLNRSAGVVAAAGNLEIAQGFGQWLIGGVVQAKQVYAVAVITAKVEGQVRCLFDAKGAFAFGAGVAVTSTLLRFFFGRR